MENNEKIHRHHAYIFILDNVFMNTFLSTQVGRQNILPEILPGTHINPSILIHKYPLSIFTISNF